MKDNKIQFIGMLLIVVILVVMFISKIGGKENFQSKVDSQNQIVQTSDQTVVKLSALQNGSYSPQIIKAKLGTKIKIVGDVNTLTGGMDTVIIDGYGINKKVSTSDNVVEFVASKPGQYSIHCANNMGNGKLIVE
jgi:plastocyanin domain-containing protein